MEKPGKYMSGPASSGFVRDYITEYMPKKETVKQVASITERWCDVRQVATALHSLLIRHNVSSCVVHQEEP